MEQNHKISPKEAYEKNKKQRSIDDSIKRPSSSDAKLLAQRLFGVVFFVAVVGGVIWFGYTKLGVGHFDPTTTCITAETYHVHPHLTIKINGQEQDIPANIGNLPCTLPLHTHDTDGVIHVENAFEFEAKLSQFFTVWKKTFNSNEILGYKADDVHEIVMTVDGQLSEDYENLVLRDGQDIVIEYREKIQK